MKAWLNWVQEIKGGEELETISINNFLKSFVEKGKQRNGVVAGVGLESRGQ